MSIQTEIEKLKDLECIAKNELLELFDQNYNKLEEAHKLARTYALEVERLWGTKPNYSIEEIKK